MYGYMIYGISDAEALAERCLHQEHVCAWVPESEKWYSSNGKKAYVIKKLYSDCMIAFSDVSYSVFCNMVFSLTEACEHVSKEQIHIHVLSKQEYILVKQLFCDKTYIECSVGRISDSKLLVEKGPLKGLEQEIMKIDRHHRTAIMKSSLAGRLLKVPLEVVSKS